MLQCLTTADFVQNPVMSSKVPHLNTALHTGYLRLDKRCKMLWIWQFLNILPTTASIYRPALSVPRCTFSGDQYNIAAKCILSIYSQPFRCYLLTYYSTLFYLKEQSVWKHIDVISILWKKSLCIICCYMYPHFAELTIQTFYRSITLPTHTYPLYSDH